MIFISHSRSDADFVERLSRHLTHEHVKIWKDTTHLRPGAAVTPEILDAIASASYFCIVLSPRSVHSVWVARELEAALTSTRVGRSDYLLPLVMEPCEPPDALRDVNAIDFTVDFDAGLRRLLTVVGRKYNVNHSGRLEDARDYFFDYLVALRDDGQRGADVDMVAFDVEANYSTLAQVRVRGDLPGDEAGTLRFLLEVFEGPAGLVRVTGNDVAHATHVVGETEVTLRVARLGRVPKNTLLFPIRACLRQICLDEGIITDD